MLVSVDKPLPWCVGRDSNPLHGVLEAPLVPNEFQRMCVLYIKSVNKSMIYVLPGGSFAVPS